MIVNKISELTLCEIYVMKILWAAKEDLICKEVKDGLNEKYHMKYCDTTVYTFLKKLCDKGIVESYKKGITFYRPVLTELDFQTEYLNRIIDLLFYGDKDKCINFIQYLDVLDHTGCNNLQELNDYFDEVKKRDIEDKTLQEFLYGKGIPVYFDCEEEEANRIIQELGLQE